MEKTGCKIICGAPTTLAVKELMMIMMMILFSICLSHSLSPSVSLSLCACVCFSLSPPLCECARMFSLDKRETFNEKKKKIFYLLGRCSASYGMASNFRRWAFPSTGHKTKSIPF